MAVNVLTTAVFTAFSEYDFNSEAAEYSPSFQFFSVFCTFRSQYL